MIEFILESPMTIAAVGIGISLLAAIMWTQLEDVQFQRISLYSAVGILLLTLVFIAVSLQVKTEKEAIRELLYDVAESLEKNDHPAVLAAIHPNASETVQQAKGLLKRLTFSDARVTRIKSIEFNESKPPTAIVHINVVVNVKMSGGGGRGARFVRLYLMKRDRDWLVRDFEHFDVSVGFQNNALTTP